MGDVFDLRFIQIGGDFDGERDVFSVRSGKLRLFVFQGFEQRAQLVAALQCAEVFGVGRGNIDGNVTCVCVGFFKAD